MNHRANDHGDSDRPLDVDALAGDWLDDAIDVETLAKLDEAARRRLVDLTLVHVLLEQSQTPHHAVREERIRRVMNAIDETSPVPCTSPLASDAPDEAPRNGWHRLLLTGLSAAAAVLLVGVVLYWTGGPARVAQAAVQEAVRDAARLQDRQYQVWSQVRLPSGQLVEFEALLYVRGGERFALRHPGPLGDVWIGSNGRQAWIRPVLRDKLISNNIESSLAWARTEGVGLPDLQLTALLSRFADQYQLQLLPNESLAGDAGVEWQRIRGIRRDPTPTPRQQFLGSAPRRVHLWADRLSGVARRVVLDWQLPPNQPGLARITLELLSEEPMEDAWYEPETHLPTPFVFSKPPRVIETGK